MEIAGRAKPEVIHDYKSKNPRRIKATFKEREKPIAAEPN